MTQNIPTEIFRASLLVLITSFGLSACNSEDGSGVGGGDSGGNISGSWTRQLGAAGAVTNGESVAVDSNGNVVVAGYTNGGLDGNTRTGLLDFYIAKYDASGNKQFTKQLGTASKPTYGYAVATDSSNNIYVTGYTYGSLDGQIQVGTWDMFLTKHDSNGVKQFTKELGAIGKTTSAKAVAIDSSDNVYVAGYTQGYLAGEARTGTQDMFLVKYDTDGNRIFTRLLGDAATYTFGQSVAIDGSGNIYVAGYTSGNLDGNAAAGILDCFVTKYDNSGNRQFTKQLGVSGKTCSAQAVATDNSGNIYVTGYTNASLDGNTVTGSGDMFLIVYDSLGTKISTKLLGVESSYVQGLSIATDSMGNAYVTGYTNAGIAGNALTGTSDLFVIKYDTGGIKAYVRQLGVAGADTTGRSLAFDSSDNFYVAGFTTGSLDGATRTSLLSSTIVMV